MTTLFLGDLSIYCEEKDIFELFRKYGPVESVQIKRSDNGKTHKPHLSYGFVKYVNAESAQVAFSCLNGCVFLGRPLRVGWASNNINERNHPFFHTVKAPTAQVHFTFLCPLERYPVKEDQLRFYFETFGNVLDVTINRVEVSREQMVHSGYGFIHYELSPKGVNSALAAIQTMHERSVDSVVFACTPSHGLMNYLRGNKREPSPPSVFPPERFGNFSSSKLSRSSSIGSNGGGSPTSSLRHSISSIGSNSSGRFSLGLNQEPIHNSKIFGNRLSVPASSASFLPEQHRFLDDLVHVDSLFLMRSPLMHAWK